MLDKIDNCYDIRFPEILFYQAENEPISAAASTSKSAGPSHAGKQLQVDDVISPTTSKTTNLAEKIDDLDVKISQYRRQMQMHESEIEILKGVSARLLPYNTT